MARKMNDICIEFYVYDDLNRFLDKFILNSSLLCEPKQIDSRELDDNKCQKKKFVKILKVDGYFLSAFSHLIKVSEFYSNAVAKGLMQSSSHISQKKCCIKFQLVKPKFEVIDYVWNEKISNLVLQRQEQEQAMSWLSTLGGAFSALGDKFENHVRFITF